MPTSRASRGLVEADRPAVEDDLALARRMEAGEDLHQRRLAGAVVADHAQHLALGEMEVDVIERGDRAEELARCCGLPKAAARDLRRQVAPRRPPSWRRSECLRLILLFAEFLFHFVPACQARASAWRWQSSRPLSRRPGAGIDLGKALGGNREWLNQYAWRSSAAASSRAIISSRGRTSPPRASRSSRSATSTRPRPRRRPRSSASRTGTGMSTRCSTRRRSTSSTSSPGWTPTG